MSTLIGFLESPNVLIRWSPNGDRLATRAFKGTPVIWLVDIPTVVEIANNRLTTHRDEPSLQNSESFWDPLDPQRWNEWILDPSSNAGAHRDDGIDAPLPPGGGRPLSGQETKHWQDR